METGSFFKHQKKSQQNLFFILSLSLRSLRASILTTIFMFFAFSDSAMGEIKFSAELKFKLNTAALQPNHPPTPNVVGHVAVFVRLAAQDKCAAAREVEQMINKPYPKEFEAFTCKGSKQGHRPSECKITLKDQIVTGGSILEGGGPGYLVLCKVGNYPGNLPPCCDEPLTS